MSERPLPPHVLAALARGMQRTGVGQTFACAVEPAPRRAPRIKVAPKDERTEHGILFASKKEANRYRELVLMRNNLGEVSFFLRQVPFHLPGGKKYVLDFMVFWSDGRVTYEDVKGMRTEVYELKKSLVESLYPIRIDEL